MSEVPFEVVKPIIESDASNLLEFFSEKDGAFIIPVYQYRKHQCYKLSVYSLLEKPALLLSDGTLVCWSLSIVKRDASEDSIVDMDICFRVGLGLNVKIVGYKNEI